MNYIYDIILNFNEDLYEFFEWRNSDDIINVRKIPVLKVDNKTYFDLKNNKVKVSEETLNNIKKSFSLYNERIEGNFICIFTNSNSAFATMFDSNGNLIKRSCMLFDEESEVISESENIKQVEINFVINEEVKGNIISRVAKEKITYIKDFIDNIKDDVTLKYIYYDYYEEECNKGIKEKLLKELNCSWNSKLNKLYELTKILNDVK